MPETTRRGPRWAAALAGGVAILTLSGCGGLYPGAAAQVGDTTISRSRVDDITRIRCDLSAATTGAQAQARATVQQSTVNVLVESERDLAFGKSRRASYDTATLRTQVQQFTDSVTKLSAKDRALLVDTYSDSVKGALMLANVGAKALQAKGNTKPNLQDSVAEGTKLARAWAKKHLPIEIDPRYNPGASGQAGGGDGSISRPVSSYATSAAGKPSATFLSSLPAPLRCG